MSKDCGASTEFPSCEGVRVLRVKLASFSTTTSVGLAFAHGGWVQVTPNVLSQQKYSTYLRVDERLEEETRCQKTVVAFMQTNGGL